MKKNLLMIGLLAISFLGKSQVCHVDTGGLFYVGEGALVYNGGGIQTKDTGKYDIHGNVMVVGSGTDAIRTLDATSTVTTPVDKTTALGGNFILRLNTTTAAGYATSTYGQLYISGLAQGNIKGTVDKEYRSAKNGTYQQIGLPFYNKTISDLSTEFAKTFSNVRYSQDEVLTWNNATAVSQNLAITATTPKNTAYYMLGSKNLDTSAPPATMNANTATNAVFTLKGVPYADGISETLSAAAASVTFGTGGNALNQYLEKYNSYLQDNWDYSSGPWTLKYGKNIYQFSNPFLTNIDLSRIGYNETGTVNDGNNISTIQGIRYDPGTVTTLPSGSTYSTAAKFVNFTSTSTTTSTSNQVTPVGDVDLLIIKPMQTFVIKLNSSASQTLNFDTLRRFKGTARADGTSYSVTAARNAAKTTTNTVKQLGVIGLDANGKELARTYYVVYANGITGHTSDVKTQATASSTDILGTFEEEPINGGYDTNYTGSYWLYINEANETNFFGKPIPLNIYSTDIKSFKFEVREDAALIVNGVHNLSSGTGFYYKSATGAVSEIAQNQIVPVVGNQYSLYYGQTSSVVLGTQNNIKPSRTMVVYNPAIDNYIVRFDSSWKKAEVNVYDLSGKLVISKKGISADADYVINLDKLRIGYLVTVISEKGEKVSSKIVR